MPSHISPEVIDSITITNTQTIAIAPGFAMGNLYQAASQAMGEALLNSSQAQKNSNVLNDAVIVRGSKMILDNTPS